MILNKPFQDCLLISCSRHTIIFITIINLNPPTFIEVIRKEANRTVTLFQIEEFLPIYSQAKKDKDQGQYEDFLECLKLYDKNENGLMLGAELTHTLLALGNYIKY